jgi:hypothetical protein
MPRHGWPRWSEARQLMKQPQPPPQLTPGEFNAALKEAGFGVEHARIIDVSGRCPGFTTTASASGARLGRP